MENGKEKFGLRIFFFNETEDAWLEYYFDQNQAANQSNDPFSAYVGGRK